MTESERDYGSIRPEMVTHADVLPRDAKMGIRPATWIHQTNPDSTVVDFTIGINSKGTFDVAVESTADEYFTNQRRTYQIARAFEKIAPFGFVEAFEESSSHSRIFTAAARSHSDGYIRSGGLKVLFIGGLPDKELFNLMPLALRGAGMNDNQVSEELLRLKTYVNGQKIALGLFNRTKIERLRDGFNELKSDLVRIVKGEDPPRETLEQMIGSSTAFSFERYWG